MSASHKENGLVQQIITGGQVLGVVLALVGATIMTVGDMVYDMMCGKKKKGNDEGSDEGNKSI